MGLSRSGFSEGNSQGLWDIFWKRHNAQGKATWAKQRITEILSDYVKPGMSVLDAGCGSGFFSSYFISCKCDVYSMDYSEEAISMAKDITRGRSKMYIKGDVLDGGSLEGLDRRFDIIFTDGLLEHYSADEQERIISSLRRLKREDGYIINFVPNRTSLWSMVRPFYMNIRESPFVMFEFMELHQRMGLDVVRSGGINVLPFRVSPERLLGRYAGMLLYCIAR